jgi:hypothetical protein
MLYPCKFHNRCFKFFSFVFLSFFFLIRTVGWDSPLGAPAAIGPVVPRPADDDDDDDDEEEGLV